MIDQLRLVLYWPQRVDPLPVLSRQVHRFITDIAPLHPKLGSFFFYDRYDQQVASADSAEACERALIAGTVRWKTGTIERTSYEQDFFLEQRLAAPFAFRVTCGIPPLGLDPIWVPNRIEVRARPGDERATRAVLEGVLRQAVAVWNPDWGFAGTERFPSKPLPLRWDGSPVVGWMTYLRAGYPPVPRTLPKPTVAYPMEGGGTLVVAHPEPPRTSAEGETAAVERIALELRATGVLVPPPAVIR